MLQTLFNMFMRMWQIPAYVYLYEKYRLFDLMPLYGEGFVESSSEYLFGPEGRISPSRSLKVWALWLFCVIVADLVYYWFHRCAHEFQLLWDIG